MVENADHTISITRAKFSAAAVEEEEAFKPTFFFKSSALLPRLFATPNPWP